MDFELSANVNDTAELHIGAVVNVTTAAYNLPCGSKLSSFTDPNHTKLICQP